MTTRPLILAFAAMLAPSAAVRAEGPEAGRKPAAAETAKPAAKAQAPCPATGTRIRQKAPQCRSFGPARSYDQKDLQSTGETDLNEALKKLDPIFH